MGGLVQQINLYRVQDDKGAMDKNVRVLLFSAVGALCLVLVLAVAGEFYVSGVADDRNRVAQNLRKQEAELAKFKASIVTPTIDPFLEAELSRLHEAKNNLHANLMAIARQTETVSEGFSAYFGGLARNTLEGLWFRNVAVSAGGQDMWLKGRTTEPELVPRLLQILAAEQAFAGRTFRKVSFERQDIEAGALVDFELRSAQSGEADDAG